MVPEGLEGAGGPVRLPRLPQEDEGQAGHLGPGTELHRVVPGPDRKMRL